MPNPALDEFESELWTAVYNLILRETALPSPGPGANPTGRLQPVQDVQKSLQLPNDVFPAIGVQSRGYREIQAFSSQHIVTFAFTITCAANSKGSTGPPPTKPSLADAQASLQTITSDGNGNGVGPVLRDHVKNYAPIAGIIMSRITGMDRRAELQPGTPAQIIAYADYHVEYQAKVYVGR